MIFLGYISNSYKRGKDVMGEFTKGKQNKYLLQADKRSNHQSKSPKVFAKQFSIHFYERQRKKIQQL